MKTIEVESFSATTNAPVIRMPGRKFPGIVIQGDSMKILLTLAHEIARLCQDSSIPELEDSANEMVSRITGYLRSYENALAEHDHPLPYPTR